MINYIMINDKLNW